MIKFVKHLKQLNEQLDFDLPKLSIDDILSDPKGYAYAIVEREFTKALPKFIESHEAGKVFSYENRGIMLINKSRFYLDNTPVDDKLPPKYGYGDTLNHPKQLCNNCKFFISTKTGDYCSQWDADVKDQYWCAKWKESKDG